MHHTLPSHKPLEVTDEMLQKARTIFRVVGGYDQHSTGLCRYEILPHLLIHSTDKFYTTSRNGKVELQKRRTTTNSQWFEDPDEALDCILERIRIARESIFDSAEKIADAKPIRSGVYVVKFKQEYFRLWSFEIISETGKGVKIEGKFRGKRYIYLSGKPTPHNPDSPFQILQYTDLDYLKSQVATYAESRLRYLAMAKLQAIQLIMKIKENNDVR